MSIIGYTPGGSPIIWGNTGGGNYKPRTRNKRFSCTACPNRTTHRQLKVNGSVCFACKTPIEFPKIG